VPDQCRKMFFLNKLILATPPPPPPLPSPKQFRSVYHFKGSKFFQTYQNFSKHQTNFPNITKLTTKLTEFPTKLTELRICPIYFYNKPILPDCKANIARLAFLPNKLAGGLIKKNTECVIRMCIIYARSTKTIMR
jgi:hypothetical protein